MIKVFKGFDRRLGRELRTQRNPIVKGLACVVASALLTSSTILLVKYATQAVSDVATGKDTAAGMRLLALSSLAVVVIYGFKYFFTRGQAYYLAKATTALSNNLRLRVFAKLQRLPIAYFNERRTGGIQSILSNDINVYQTAVSVVRDAIEGPVKALSAFITVLAIQWQLSLVSLLMIPVMGLIIQRNGRKMKVTQAAVQRDLAELQAFTQEAIQGAKVVKAFNAEDRVVASYEDRVKALYDSTMASAKTFAKLRPLVELMGAVALALVFYICGFLAREGQLAVSDIAALVMALDVINQGVKSVGYVNSTYNQVQAAADRIYGEVLDAPEEHEAVGAKRTLDDFTGHVEFRDVSFTYPDGTQAVDRVSFVIEPGKSLALVGPSGSGKSTIADLLQKFYSPTSGTILFDGVDLRDLDARWVRTQIGIVPQQTFLFAGSIAENIRLGSPQATDEQVMAAATAAHANDFIAKLPNRYETTTGERGVGLSGGEMQRVSIARALIRQPRLLLLDEATSNLDSVSEQAVQAALEAAMRTRTTLLIAHRLTTAARADKIIVLAGGQVIEEGSHRSLMETNGTYAGMYRAFGAGVLG